MRLLASSEHLSAALLPPALGPGLLDLRLREEGAQQHEALVALRRVQHLRRSRALQSSEQTTPRKTAYFHLSLELEYCSYLSMVPKDVPGI